LLVNDLLVSVHQHDRAGEYSLGNGIVEGAVDGMKVHARGLLNV
jgi:hypothetical protein